MKKSIIPRPLLFEWDEGNNEKSVKKHNVKNSEAEEIFFNDPIILPDRIHSEAEDRFYAFGITNKKRKLLMAFTLRGQNKEKIRPIMSRDQNKKERKYYEEYVHKMEVKNKK